MEKPTGISTWTNICDELRAYIIAVSIGRATPDEVMQSLFPVPDDPVVARARERSREVLNPAVALAACLDAMQVRAYQLNHSFHSRLLDAAMETSDRDGAVDASEEMRAYTDALREHDRLHLQNNLNPPAKPLKSDGKPTRMRFI